LCGGCDEGGGEKEGEGEEDGGGVVVVHGCGLGWGLVFNVCLKRFERLGGWWLRKGYGGTHARGL
jgi:hypothetical protein